MSRYATYRKTQNARGFEAQIQEMRDANAARKSSHALLRQRMEAKLVSQRASKLAHDQRVSETLARGMQLISQRQQEFLDRERIEPEEEEKEEEEEEEEEEDDEATEADAPPPSHVPQPPKGHKRWAAAFNRARVIGEVRAADCCRW
jgi:hypothetical protein